MATFRGSQVGVQGGYGQGGGGQPTWSTYAEAGTGGQGSGAPTFTAGMSPDQVRQAVTQYFKSRGVEPDPSSIDYWTQKYSSPEFGGDINYFQQRLSQADEFGGGGGGGTGLANGSLLQPWTQQFQAPTDITEQNDPGFQFRLKQGVDAISHSAAAKGTLLTGGTLKDLTAYGQDFASNEYSNVYNRALQQYGIAQQNFYNNEDRPYNKLLGLSQLGEGAATTTGGLLTGNGNAQGAAAIQQGNIWGGYLNGLGSLYNQYEQNQSPVSVSGTSPYAWNQYPSQPTAPNSPMQPSY